MRLANPTDAHGRNPVPPSLELDQLFEEATGAEAAGRLQEASDLYQRILAIQPGHAAGLHRLGIVAHLVGRPDVAATLIKASIESDGTIAAVHNDLGEMYRLQGQLGEAERAFRQALVLDPAIGSAANNLAILLHGMGRLDAAIGLYRQAVAAMPEASAPLMNLGSALLAAGDIAGAVRSLEAARRLAPNDAAVMLNLGNARMAEDRPELAAELYRAALAIQPDYSQAALNLGKALRELGEPRQALVQYEAAIRLAPASAVAKWNAGCCHLLLGDYRAGWAGFAERWNAGAVPPHGLGAPLWDGGDLAGKRLLVHAEQGLGDTIQFLRFMPLLAKTDASAIYLLCQPPLRKLLLANGFPVTPTDAAPPDHDLRVPLLDLPRLFDITLETLPGPAAYLSADATALEAWRRRLPAGRRIGLVWRGRPDHANDRARSMALSCLAPLLDLPGIAWCSLQKDRQETLPDAINDLAPWLDDLGETAAAIMALDAVIAVDTAVAHLAGALGKPVHLLLPFAPDWRWLVERDDTPWYPSVELYRQSRRGDWAGAVARIRASLSADAG